MSAEYVDPTPIGDGGSPLVTLPVAEPEAQAAETEQPVQVDPVAQASEQTDQPVAESAAAEPAEVQSKTPEEKASYWRGEHFKTKQTLESRVAELEGQLTEANATPAFLKIDKPPGEWNPEEQLSGMPQAYQEKVLSHGFWRTLPNVIENLDSQPPDVQNALYETMDKVFQKQTGVSFEEMVNRLDNSPQTQQPTPQANLVQELETKGYTDADPELRAAKWAASQETRINRLEAAQQGSTKQHEAFQRQQEAVTRQQAEAAFESKRTAVWDNALKTFENKVPQGKEFMLDFIRDRAEKLVTSDPTATGHLDKVKNFLLAAANPQERAQYESLASGSLAAYNAKVAIAIQSAAKFLLGEAAETEALRSAVVKQQEARRDIVPGQSFAPSGSREDILKTRIDGNADVASEMAAAIYRARKAS